MWEKKANIKHNKEEEENIIQNWKIKHVDANFYYDKFENLY